MVMTIERAAKPSSSPPQRNAKSYASSRILQIDINRNRERWAADRDTEPVSAQENLKVYVPMPAGGQ